jgi:hypothetical protein
MTILISEAVLFHGRYYTTWCINPQIALNSVFIGEKSCGHAPIRVRAFRYIRVTWAGVYMYY